jgi:hypothetical protein
MNSPRPLVRPLGSWVRIPLKQGVDVCVHLFCVYVLLCVGSGLVTTWPPVQGVLPTVYRVKKLRNRPKSNKRTVEPQIDKHVFLNLMRFGIVCPTLRIHNCSYGCGVLMLAIEGKCKTLKLTTVKLGVRSVYSQVLKHACETYRGFALRSMK